MPTTRRPPTRSRLAVLFRLGCVLALFPFATGSSWSQDPKEEPKDGPPDEVGEVRSVDISAVGPVSFDGDVRELTPVAMDHAQIDLLSELELPEVPVGPDFPSAPKQAAALT